MNRRRDEDSAKQADLEIATTGHYSCRGDAENALRMVIRTHRKPVLQFTNTHMTSFDLVNVLFQETLLKVMNCFQISDSVTNC